MTNRRNIKNIIIFIVVLCTAVLPLLSGPLTYADESSASAAATFHYHHDPRLNPKAMADIVYDPSAVYGFSPSPDGSIKQYAGLNWTDSELVNGKNAREERIAYYQGIKEMHTLLANMRAEGKSTEEIARAVSAKRNEIRLSVNAGDPEGLKMTKERNLEEYGHEEGPLPEELYKKYGSWETVIEKAFSMSSGMDACTGLYDEYFELYLAAGQVPPDDSGCTRADAVSFIWRTEGSPISEKSTFQDTDRDAYYAPAVDWAFSAGIVQGHDALTFAPDSIITREQMTVMLCNYAHYKEIDTSASMGTAGFVDSDEISSWSDNAFSWICGTGLISEMTGIKLEPRKAVTREEYTQVMHKFEDYCMSAKGAQPADDSLQKIKERGVLLVGTAGDYQPMSYLDPESDTYVGFDAALAEDLAESLGVKIEYVKTSWPALMEDTRDKKFDAAICGITINDARKEQALMSDGYLGNGKTVLCRAEDADKYTGLEAINRPDVKVMENPGGLNEKFARENLPDAELIIHDVNQEIPGLIAEGKADVMITEVAEAEFYCARDSRLAAPLADTPFTEGQMGVLMPKGSEALLNYVNNFLKKERVSGRLDDLIDICIHQSQESQAIAA